MRVNKEKEETDGDKTVCNGLKGEREDRNEHSDIVCVCVCV